jgi:hypothetical protein
MTPLRLLPGPGDTTPLARLLREKASWSVFWDKRYRLWRAAEDDPHSALYVESSDMDAVIGYITSHP